MKNEPVDILFVEDNPDHIELVLEALQENGVLNTIHVIQDGQVALDYLFQREPYQNAPQPGLILLDINLPKVDGIQVLKQIKNDEHLKAIPVIILSTSSNAIDVQSSYDNGANSYIVKPVDFEKFQRAIKELKLYWLVSNQLPS